MKIQIFESIIEKEQQDRKLFYEILYKVHLLLYYDHYVQFRVLNALN